MTTFTEKVSYSVSCPNNDGGKIVKIGKRDGKQRYRCEKCLKKFRDPNVYSEGHHHPSQQMGMALQSHFDGSSYSKIARNVARTFDVEAPDDATVFRWIQGFSRAAHDAMRRQKVRVGDRWVADEMVLKVEGRQYWMWNIMDSKTRYVLAVHLTPRRTKEAAAVVIRKAIEAAGKRPKTFVSDQLGSYIQPTKMLMPKTKHVPTEGLDAQINNNLSERLQGMFRDRTKTQRGFKSQETGQVFLEGFVADYNLLRPHKGLGDRTPAEAAGVTTPFKNWREVVDKLECNLTPSRPEWHFKEPPLVEMKKRKKRPTPIEPLAKMIPAFREPADKQFTKMDIPTALEAIYPMRKKAFKSSKPKEVQEREREQFRKRRGF